MKKRKNPAAVALGKLSAKKRKRKHQQDAANARWSAMTPEERAAEMSRVRRLGIRGGNREADVA